MNFLNDRWGAFFYKYLLTKHKKSNISAFIHMTRKKFIYSGRYLKGTHFGKKIGHGGAFKNAEGRVSKTNNVKLNLQTPNFHKAFYRP